MLTDPMKNLSSLAGVEPIKVSADIMVEDGMTLQVGNIRLKAIHTPGHTRGGLCYLAEGVLFTGDTLFAGSVGRTDLPGGSHHTLIKSIRQKLFILEDDLTVFPGHGPISSLRQERISNPYLQGREELEWE